MIGSATDSSDHDGFAWARRKRLEVARSQRAGAWNKNFARLGSTSTELLPRRELAHEHTPEDA